MLILACIMFVYSVCYEKKQKKEVVYHYEFEG